ncbi:unnamed protein product [Schistocephalus solidus]|uniref:Uncharacterized protein n=1 Tax=Schistocephalus solidus TaxID=70667 RepID=A0A183SKB8_SCHSO|nr:unnamed protein product [Schistocephalus solidus]
MLEESFATEDLSETSDLIDIHFIISDNLLTEAWTVSKAPKPMEGGFMDRSQDVRLASPRSRRLRGTNSISWLSAGQVANESVGTQGDLEPPSFRSIEFIPPYQGFEGCERTEEDLHEHFSPNCRSIQSCNPRPHPRGRTRPMDSSITPTQSCHPAYESAPRPQKSRRSRALRAPNSPLSREKPHSARRTPVQVPKTSRRCRAEALSSPKYIEQPIRSPVYIKFPSNRSAGRSPETVTEYTQSMSRAHAVAQMRFLQNAYVTTAVTGVSYAVCQGKDWLRIERRRFYMATLDRKHRRSFKRSPALMVPSLVLGKPLSYKEIDNHAPVVSTSPHRASDKAHLYVERCTQYEDTELEVLTRREDRKLSYSQLIEINVGDKRSQECKRGSASDGGVEVKNRSTSYNEIGTELVPAKHSQAMHRSVYWMYVPLKPVDSQHNLECRCIQGHQMCTCTTNCDLAQTWEAELKT